MRIDLLEDLATALESFKNTPKLKFDLSDWWKEEGCNTTACAMGLACTLPSFQKAGFGLDAYSYTDGPGIVSKNITFATSTRFKQRLYGSAAIAEGLGLTDDEVDSLFYYSSYPSRRLTQPSEVAARIRALVAKAKDTTQG